MTIRITLLDFMEGKIPEDRRFIFDLKLFGIPSIVNNTLWVIKKKWPQCEGVSVVLHKSFPVDDGIVDEQFQLEIYDYFKMMEIDEKDNSFDT